MFKDKITTRKPVLFAMATGLLIGHIVTFAFISVIYIKLGPSAGNQKLLENFTQNLGLFFLISLLSSSVFGWGIMLLFQREMSLHKEQASNGLHEIIINSMSDCLVVFGENQEIKIENKSFKENFNPWNKEYIQEIFNDEILDTICKKEKVNAKTVTFFDNNLEKNIHYILKVEPFKFYDDGKEVSQCVVSLTNVEAQYQEEELLKVQMATVESSSRLSSLGEMATGFAHEINNPLSVISANNLILKKLLQKVELDEKAQGKFDKLTNSVDQTIQRISKIIDSLRSLAKNTHDEIVFVSVKDLVEEFRVLAKVKVYQLGIDFSIEDECEDGATIPCSKSAISQVFMNLISNSIDALSGKKEKWIKIKFVDKIDFVDIIISDSGDGIPSSIVDKIFQPMFTTKDIGQGMGLGLSIAHSLVEKQGGELVLDESRENTTFIIKLRKKSLVEEEYKETA